MLNKMERFGFCMLGLLFCSIVLVVMSSFAVYAQEIFVSADSSEEPVTISDVRVLEQNYFYFYDYVIGDVFLDNLVIALDSDDNVLFKEPQGFQLTMLPFDVRVSRISIYSLESYRSQGLSARPLASKDLSF